MAPSSAGGDFSRAPFPTTGDFLGHRSRLIATLMGHHSRLELTSWDAFLDWWRLYGAPFSIGCDFLDVEVRGAIHALSPAESSTTSVDSGGFVSSPD